MNNNCTRQNNKFRRGQDINQLTSANKRLKNSILVGVNNKLAINNPIIKRTRSGRKFVEHKQVPLQALSPDCYCHERTYLAPHNHYYECEDCQETHYVHCVESHYNHQEELRYADKLLCSGCWWREHRLRGEEEDKQVTSRRQEIVEQVRIAQLGRLIELKIYF